MHSLIEFAKSIVRLNAVQNIQQFETKMSDPLSDILEQVGVEGSVYFQKDFHGPWCMDVSNTGFAQFHIIVNGNARVTHDGQVLQLSAGDIVLFPKGASHLIGDADDSPVTVGSDVIRAISEGQEPFTEGVTTTRMICGHFEYDFGYAHPLLEELPEKILIRSADLPALDQLLGVMQLIIKESSSEAPGSRVVARKLSDGLFVTILRSFFEREKERSGFFRGLLDERIARAIEAIHSDISNQLTVDDMAKLAGMSRSSFSQQFKLLVGQSAGSYATRWKLLNARSAIKNSMKPIETIAFSSGYSSATAFSRAFHTMFGETPSECRQKKQQPN